MSGLITAVVATAVVPRIASGIGAMGNKGDVASGRGAAYDIFQQQKGLLGEEKTLTTEAAETASTTGQVDIGIGAKIAQTQISGSADVSRQKADLAMSGTIESKVKTQTKDLMSKYKSDMTKLFETRNLALTQADISYRKGEMTAEEAYQSTLTGLESTPTTFAEGFWG